MTISIRPFITTLTYKQRVDKSRGEDEFIDEPNFSQTIQQSLMTNPGSATVCCVFSNYFFFVNLQIMGMGIMGGLLILLLALHFYHQCSVQRQLHKQVRKIKVNESDIIILRKYIEKLQGRLDISES